LLESIRLLSSLNGFSTRAILSSEARVWSEVRFSRTTLSADPLASFISARAPEAQPIRRQSLDKRAHNHIQVLRLRHPDLYLMIENHRPTWLESISQLFGEKKLKPIIFDIESSSSTMDLDAVARSLVELGELTYQIWLVLKLQGYEVKPMSLVSLSVSDYYSAIMGASDPRPQQESGCTTNVKMSLHYEQVR
jgi:hypothetical protein